MRSESGPTWTDLIATDTSTIEVAGGFDDTAVLMYTSGSTGSPKGVPLSHRNLFFASVNYLVDTDLTSEDTTLVTSPLFHVGGLNIFTLPLLHTGGTVVLQADFEPVQAWELLERHGVTKLFAIPTILNTMLSVDAWQDRELDALELVVSGGEPVPRELKDAFQEIGVPCVAAYGLTETTDGSLILRPDNAAGKPAECNGRPFTHVDAKVVDPDGNECPPGETGELLHRGPTVADGYHERPDVTAETWTDDGWLHTGDLAMVDEDGFYHIHGRADNMIISGGENIYPAEVENVLYSHESIEEAVVFGVPDEEWGEIVKAVIVTTTGEPIAHDRLRAFLADELARFKHPKDVEFAEELPQSGTGKIERQTVVEQYGKQ
jgi:fatty-acyl-CoA synthase